MFDVMALAEKLRATADYIDRHFADAHQLTAQSELRDSALCMEQLKRENVELRAAMQWFVDRVERGEVHSRRTYAQFKELLLNPEVSNG